MTKEEIKDLIKGITKENTTDRLHAEILNAIVDNMGGSELIKINIPNYGSAEEDWLDITEYLKDVYDTHNPQNFALISSGDTFYFNGGRLSDDGYLSATYGYYSNNLSSGIQITIRYDVGDNIFEMYWSDIA